MGWRGRWGGSGWGTHVNPWLIHVNVWHKPIQNCKVISLKLIKINEKKIAEKRREAKGKGEKERYNHLNAEFQRPAKRDKKAFLGDQYKNIEKNNRMGKTRDLFKKIRDTREHFRQRWIR